MLFNVKDGLNFKIVNELSPFEEKIFESLTIQLSYPSKQPILLTTGYRSNGTIANVTQNQQIERFLLSLMNYCKKLVVKT
jgi:hypothetical protein